MKLSQLRPCDCCGGKIAPIFNVVRISMAVMNQQAISREIGMAQICGGHLGLASIIGANEDVVKIAGDEDSKLMTELYICNDCMFLKPVNLAELMEQETARKDKLEEIKEQNCAMPPT